VVPAPGSGILGRLGHLRSGLLASGTGLVACVVVGAVLGGGTAAAGAALGVALVAGSFSGSSLAIAWADSVNPALVLPVGLTAYALKITAIGLAFVGAAGVDWPGLPAFGWAVAVTTLGWVTAQAWWTWHAKIPYVDS
jgi:hypothetical protein